MRRARAPIAAAIALLTGIAAFAPRAGADEVADFFKGKVIRIIVGFGEGGGYDLYARFASEHMGRFIPGNPTIVTQNMPGAGSKRAAKYVYSVAPKDGTVWGMVAQSVPHEAALGDAESDYDVNKFQWIGRITSNVDVGITWHTTNVKTIADAQARTVVVGGTGTASPSVQVPKALNHILGTQFKIVTGYKGSADVSLAMERGEVDMVASIGWPSIKSTRAQWVRDKQINFLYQTAVEKHPELPNIPALGELGRNADETSMLHFIASSADIGRALFAPPDTHPARLAALRRAFDAMVADAAVKADAARRNVDFETANWQKLQQITTQIMSTRPEVLARVKVALDQK